MTRPVRRNATIGSKPRVITAANVEKYAGLPDGFTPKQGMLYSVVRAISARVNQNFDGFPSEELREAAHTFVGKPIFVNHNNDDPLVARGVVVAARYVEAGDDKYIEVIQEVDAKAYPKLAREIESGGIDSVSMGCEAGFTICSMCDNKATDMSDMCDHILYHKGQTLQRKASNGEVVPQLVFERCYKLGFFELSYVFDPADETAVVSRVLTASKKTAYPKTEKCKYCDKQATERVIHSEGMAYIPCCEGHLDEAKGDAEDCVPGDGPDPNPGPSNVDRVEHISRRLKAYGEIEAPAEVDTLRNDDSDEDEGYHHYIDSPPELSDPDLDEAKRLDRVQDENPGESVDEDSQEEPEPEGSDINSGDDDGHDLEPLGYDDLPEDGTNDEGAEQDQPVPDRDEILQDLEDEPYPEGQQPIIDNHFVDGGPDPRGGQDMRTLVPHRPTSGKWHTGKETGSGYMRGDDGSFAFTSAHQLGKTGLFDWLANDGRGNATRGTALTVAAARVAAERAAQIAPTVSNAPSTRAKSYNQTTRSNAMARQTLATRGQASRRRQSDVRNDQGVNDHSGEFLSETPGGERASGGKQMNPDHQDVSSDANPKRTDPQQASRKAALREFSAFADWVASEYGVTIRRAARDNKLRGLVQRYAAAEGKSVALLMPGMKSALRQASLHKAEFEDHDDFREDEAPVDEGHDEGSYADIPFEGDEGGHDDAEAPEEVREDDADPEYAEGGYDDGRDVDLEDAHSDPYVDELEQAAEEEAAEDHYEGDEHDGAPVDEFPSEGDDPEALREARRRAAAAKRTRKAPARTASPRRRQADNMDFAKADDRVKVTAPVENTNPPRSQQDQFDLNEFATNAGDDIAKPDLSTGQNWAPGEGKSRNAKAIRASGMQAVRLAEAYIEAGLAEPSERWRLATDFERLERRVVVDRTALLERVASVQSRKIAGGVTRSTTRSPIPQNFGNGAPARTASAANDTSDDGLLFM